MTSLSIDFVFVYFCGISFTDLVVIEVNKVVQTYLPPVRLYPHHAGQNATSNTIVHKSELCTCIKRYMECDQR